MRVALALGSNVGDRIAYLRAGVHRLRDLLSPLHASGVYETAPMYEPRQEPFLNACCVGRTSLDAPDLLAVLHDLEESAGRRRDGTRRHGPRELDIDILLFGTVAVDLPDLVIPHPRMRERGFVLVPLAEIAPDWSVPDPEKGPAPTVAELAARCDTRGVTRTEHDLA